MSINREQVRQVLAAIGEEYLVDVPAVHDGKGGYFIEFSTLANALVNAQNSWLDQIVGYVNVKSYEAGSLSPGGEPAPHLGDNSYWNQDGNVA